MFPNVIEVVLGKFLKKNYFRALAALSLATMAKNRYLNQYCNLDISVKIYKTKE